MLTEFRHLIPALLAVILTVAPLPCLASGEDQTPPETRAESSTAEKPAANSGTQAPEPEGQNSPAPPPRKLSPLELTNKQLREDVAKWAKVDWKGLVRTDQLKFLQLLRQKCEETIIDFTATFYKQERIKGKLRKEEKIRMKWRKDPFSVYMKFIKGDKGKEALYVEGVHGSEIRAHRGGILSFVKVWTKPSSSKAMKNNLRPITRAGMANMLNFAMPVYERAKRNGDLKIEYWGEMGFARRRVYVIKRFLPRKINPKTGKLLYPGKVLVLYIDAVKLVPVGAYSYGWDGQVTSKYRYQNVKINIGLTDKDFDWRNKAYNLK